MTDEKKQDSKAEIHFNKLADVLTYLKEKGWRVSQASLYRHVSEGKLRTEKNGNFRQRSIDRYAKSFLTLVKTGKKIKESATDFKRKFLEQQIKLYDIKIKRLERLDAIEESKYVDSKVALAAATMMYKFVREEVMKLPGIITARLVEEREKTGKEKLDVSVVRGILNGEIRQALENIAKTQI